MKCILSLRELHGNEVETFEVDGKHYGDVLQNMENKLCNDIAPYNTYSLKNCRNIEKMATRKTLHFKDNEGKTLSYIIEIKESDFKKHI